ncbi:MAG: BrnT family toxin [Candidatus Tectomicrobia bacterium]|nr:BrnT family toxin [Candidatus Tectomicrobia bacterium]
MDFIWDSEKASINQEKHGVDFADVVTVFEDLYLLSREDPSAEGEQRFIAVGMDAQGRIHTVVYTYRGENIRLISARPASSRERRTYENRRFRDG